MKKELTTKSPNYIDLFSGCGGLSLGLHNAGWRGIFAIEKNMEAFSTLKYNLIDKNDHFDWPDWLPVQNHDINTLIRKYKNPLSKLENKVDLVAGGPPCQGFSMAGRRNESDERNSLIKSYIKFIKLLKPKLLFFENVKGFTLKFKKNNEKGKEYSTYVINALSRAGYYVKGELVNFADYGLPQKRTRFILIGIKKDLVGSNQNVVSDFFDLIDNNKHSFLLNKNLSLNTTLKDAISDLLMSNGTKDSKDSRNFICGLYSKAKTNYQILMRNQSTNRVPDSHRFPNHKSDTIKRFKYILDNCTKNKDIDTQTRKKLAIKKHTVIPLKSTEKTPTITTAPDDYIHYCEPRILTVREYARLQSFPDWFEFKGKYTTGGKRRKVEVPRYSQIGNAIPPLFSEQSGLVLKQLIS